MSTSKVDLSIVVPLNDEADNVEPLHDEIAAAVRALERSYEIVFVDDGSRDATFDKLKRIAFRDRQVRIVRLARNYGQTAALQAGFDHARGEVILTIDGDLQNDPADFGQLLAGIDEGYDVVCGWRKNRQDNLLSRKLISWAANKLIRLITGVTIHDTGCTLKAYRRKIARRMRLHSDMHRLIPMIVALSGGRFKEIAVGHRPRRFGRSKYGISRTWKVALDLILLTMMMRFSTFPGRWFALMSLPFWLLTAVSLAASAYQYLNSAAAARTPIVFPATAMLFAFASVNLMIMAVIGEFVVSTGDERENAAAVERVESTWEGAR